MAKSSNKSTAAGAGCLTLFSLPFVAVGVGMTWWSLHVASQHTAMQSWTEVPATIKSAELKQSGKKGDSSQVVAVYEYQFDGKTYTGERVGLHGGSDNIGHFQRDAFQELKQHLDQRKPFHCYVDPSKPADSVLYRNLRGEMLGFYTLFATLFGSVGIGIMSASLLGTRYAPKSSIVDAPADQPWLAREDWANGQIRPAMAAKATASILGVIALYWCIATSALVWKLPEIVRQENIGAWKWLMLVFPGIALLLVGSVVYQAARSRKFGESLLQLASTPGVVGGQLAGVIQIPKLITATDGFRLRLSCMGVRISSKGKEQEDAIWQDERIVTDPMHDNLSDQTAVPVLFAIPFDARATSTREVRWRLDASARMPGVDYSAQFEVPVFKTAGSRADFKLDETLAADFAAPPDRDLLLREAGLRRESLPSGGVQIVFPAARNWTTGIFMTAVSIVLSGVLYVIGPKAMPMLAQAVLGLILIVFLWIALDIWFYRSIVTADANELTSRGGLFGLGRVRTLPASDVKEFTTAEYMSSGANVWRSIEVVPREGKKWTIGKGISSRMAQQAVIDELNEALRIGRAS